MIDVNELWIGDWLLLKKSGRKGKFLGAIDQNKIRVKIDDKTILTTVSNVRVLEEHEIPQIQIYSARPVINRQTRAALSSSIDLHLEVLKPSLKNSRPERIVDFQVNAAKEFLESAIEANTRKIEIIHGKGEGVLKAEILHLLSLYEEVNFIFDKNQGGSTEIWLKSR